MKHTLKSIFQKDSSIIQKNNIISIIVIAFFFVLILQNTNLAQSKTESSGSFEKSVEKASNDIQKINRELENLLRKSKDKKFEESINGAIKNNDKDQFIKLIRSTGITGNVGVEFLKIQISIEICWGNPETCIKLTYNRR